MNIDIQYEVALSFAGEDRAFVERVAHILQGEGVRVFYDDDQRADLWGKDLFEYLDKVYRLRSQYVIMFISKHYAGKIWPNHERQSAMARSLEEKREYVLPARFDDTELPGLLPTTSYTDLRRENEESFAKLVLEKLGRIENPAPREHPATTDLPAKPKEDDTVGYDQEVKKFADAGAILKTIRSAPYWEIIIRPIIFAAERISTLPDCYEVLSSCRVARRNWEFPYVRNANISTGNDWFGGDIEFTGHRESWRLYQSGQILYNASFRESFFEEEVRKRAVFPMPKGATPAGYHDVIVMLHTITEIFEFAANYVRHGIVNDTLVIGIFMHNVKGHILFTMDRNRQWSSYYPAGDHTLGKYWSFPKTELIEQTHPIALGITNHFWHRFGWFNAPLDKLVADQTFD